MVTLLAYKDLFAISVSTNTTNRYNTQNRSSALPSYMKTTSKQTAEPMLLAYLLLPRNHCLSHRVHKYTYIHAEYSHRANHFELPSSKNIYVSILLLLSTSPVSKPKHKLLFNQTSSSCNSKMINF